MIWSKLYLNLTDNTGPEWNLDEENCNFLQFGIS